MFHRRQSSRLASTAIVLLALLETSASGQNVGSTYCSPAVPNATGAPAILAAYGTDDLWLNGNQLSLEARNVPPNQFGIFVTSRTAGFIPNAGGSLGNLCVGLPLGRYVEPGQIVSSGPAGVLTLDIDLARTPENSGFTQVLGGETWHFQAWFRDLAPGGVSASNFTDALAITFSDSDPGPGPFEPQNTALALASGTGSLAISGGMLAFMTAESAGGSQGTDYNQDGDTVDRIAVLVDTVRDRQTILDVAAEEIAFARETLFMIVSEADDARDWNGDLDVSDRVLLYARPSELTLTYLETVSSATRMVAIGDTLVYASETAPATALESNLRLTRVTTNGGAPSAPSMILTGADPNNDGISYRVTGGDGDVVFLLANEALDGDLNGDGDTTDANIFAVLDAGEVAPVAINSGLAISGASSPSAVPIPGGGEWLVAFLVDEMAEGVSLNDPALFAPAWGPPSCASADADLDDHVLHWFQLTDLALGTAAVNTGLIGEADGTAYAHRQEFVGVVMPEEAQGLASCDLNGDGDVNDLVVRYYRLQ